MSRIGKQPIAVPDGVEITIEPELVKVKGPKGELEERVSRDIGVEQENGEIVVTRPTDRGEHRALHGLTRSLIANMVEGVTNGYEKRLEIQGVGYRAQLQGNKLVLALGYSHPVEMDAPDGHRVRGARSPPGSSCAASPSRPSARSPRTSASSARRSPTRARASATRASTWPGRSASAHERQDEARSRGCAAAGACAPRSAARPSGRGCRCSARNRGIQAQLIDDVQGHTLAAVNWVEGDLKSLARMEQAKRAGELLAERAKAAGVEECVFDRGGYRYHGKVKALAEGAREGGLRF